MDSEQQHVMVRYQYLESEQKVILARLEYLEIATQSLAEDVHEIVKHLQLKSSSVSNP
jgi:hypothetical protein